MITLVINRRERVIVNIFTLLVFFLFIVVGYFSGISLSHYWGVLGWILGFIVGGSLFGTAYYLIMYYLNKWFPIHPICKDGKCTSEDYEIVKYNEEDGTFIFRCKCGTEYYQDFPYFKEILSDGSLKTYMKINRWGKWKPDD
jgi:hypothetical protein